jgi:beta-lactamase class A
MPHLRNLLGSPLRARAALVTAGLALGLVAAGMAASPVSVQGRTVDAAGRPLNGVAVRMVSEPGGSVLGEARSDVNGDYRFQAGHRVQPYHLLLTRTGYYPVTIHQGQPAVMHRVPQVRGRIVDDGGRPVPGATIEASLPGRPTIWTAVADSDGFYLMDRDLPEGRLQLKVGARYHDSTTAPVTLARDQIQEMPVAIKRQMATMNITSSPAGMQPLLDGLPLDECAGTPCSIPIPTGPHSIQLQSDLFIPWHQTINTKRGDLLELAVSMVRKLGSATITAPRLPDGELTLDGQRVSGLNWSGDLPTGDHQVAYRSSGTWPFFGTVHVDWQQQTEFTIRATPVAHDDAGFINGLNAYLASIDGHYSVYMRSLVTGHDLGVNPTEDWTAASVIKLPVVLYGYHQVDTGAIQLSDTVELTDDDFMGGTGSLVYTAQTGDKVSYDTLFSLLIRQSDNTAWMALRRVLDDGRIDAHAAALGAPRCRQGDNNCTSRDAGTLLSRLALGQALNGPSTQAVLGLLETTSFRDRIPYYLSGVTIANKVGMYGTVINDAGIVFMPNREFVLVVFSESGDTGVEVQAIRDIARAAARYFG